MNLHLVNFDFRRPVENIEVSVRVPEGVHLRAAELATPDQAVVKPLRTTTQTGVVRLRVPRLQVYDLLTLRWAKGPGPQGQRDITTKYVRP
jgi:hypothetical protein